MARGHKLVYSFTILVTFSTICSSVDIDKNGYIVYCPCMGRFGNQADHFLGALAFAKGLDRTLVLPPWVEYRPGATRSTQIPFDTYFKVEALAVHHRIITMHEFMKEIAPTLWPPEKRIAFCYMARYNSEGCNAKEGNPFGPFWDTYNIDFVGSEMYRPLGYDTRYHSMAEKWNEQYPPEKWPVLAFTGAPASFPVQKDNREIHKYLKWSDDISNRAESFIKTLPRGPFVGIHMRNGIDWARACEHVEHSPNLFAAPQCLGYRNENGNATQDLCMPSKGTIIKHLKRVIKSIGAKSVFVASDHDHMILDLTKALEKMKVAVVKLDQSSPHVDLAILGRSNHYIGNCISSFSSFAKRERDAIGLPSSFWAFPLEKEKKKKMNHDEF